MDDDGVGEPEADDGLRGNLDLLAAGDAVGACAYAAAGCRADGCAFAAAEDAAEDGSDGCAAADLFGGVFAAAFAFLGEGIGCDLDALAVAIDAESEMVRSELPLKWAASCTASTWPVTGVP